MCTTFTVNAERYFHSDLDIDATIDVQDTYDISH